MGRSPLRRRAAAARQGSATKLEVSRCILTDPNAASTKTNRSEPTAIRRLLHGLFPQLELLGDFRASKELSRHVLNLTETNLGWLTPQMFDQHVACLGVPDAGRGPAVATDGGAACCL